MQSRHERKRQRRIIAILLIGAGILFAGLIVLFIVDRYSTNRSVVFRTEEANVHFYRAKKWQDFIIKGVNISPERPGSFLGSSPGTTLGNKMGKTSGYLYGGSASKDEYSRLFKRLIAMDINVIRVYSILPPAFYKAFFEYNILTSKPLYLLHGIRLDRQDIETYRNAYEDSLNARFSEKIMRTIDVIHGKAEARQIDAQASGKYNLNVAPFVIGFNFLCEEEDVGFVFATNEKNPDVMGFEGAYFYTEHASPYEAWLAAVGNFAISYEQEKYGGAVRLVSWMNWDGTEPKLQLDEPAKYSDIKDAVKIEHIRITERFNAGILASRHLREKFAEYNEL